MYEDLLKQCQIWHEENKFDLIIESLESINEEDRTPELDMELARAYNNYADQYDYDSLNEAVRLLKKNEDYFYDDFLYHYRLGYAYYYLNKEADAAKEFEKAYSLNKEDESTKEFLTACYNSLECPRFQKRFKQRVKETWKYFLMYEEDIRNLLDNKCHQEAVGLLDDILITAFNDLSFEVGFDGTKYELVLSPEGLKSKLFEIHYFYEHAPKEVFEHWNVILGKVSSGGDRLTLEGVKYDSENIFFRVKTENSNEIGLDIYSDLFVDFLENDKAKAYFIIFNFLDHILGEISCMSYISEVNIVKEKQDDMLQIFTLKEYLKLKDFNLEISAKEYLSKYLVYEHEPNLETDYWRDDIVSGSTKFTQILHEYNNYDTNIVDEYYRNGIVSGFIGYSLEGFDSSDEIIKLRDEIENYINNYITSDIVEIIGMATGKNTGYIDFIAWDFSEFMDLMQDYFYNSNIKWAMFHTFRPYGNNITLSASLDRTKQKEILKQEQIDYLNSCLDDNSGYFYKMYEYLTDYINNGIELEEFTEIEAKETLDVSLWYSYICNNIGTYEYYIKTIRFMPYARKNALKSGTWYYRYACALIYTANLEDAIRYARVGALVEPEYPWNWLLLGKLELHFGNIDKALEAVNNGLSLVPGDYEFETLKEEIYRGATIEQTECHWIDQSSDILLQQNADTDEVFEKLMSVNSIRINYQNLKEIRNLFKLNDRNYIENNPYCEMIYDNNQYTYNITFKMNEAALSKISMEYLINLKNLLDTGNLIYEYENNYKLRLIDVVIESNLNIGYFYYSEEIKKYYVKWYDRKFNILYDLEKLS